MPKYIPTQDELYDKFMDMYATALNVNVSQLGQSIHVDCMVLSAQFYPAYLLLHKVQNNQHPEFADEEWLRSIGRIWLARDISPAVQGKYYVTVTNSEGASIAKDTVFRSNNDSTSPAKQFVTEYAYATEADVGNGIEELTNPEGTMLLRALEAGLGSKLNIGDKLTAVQPLTNAKDEVVVSAIFRAPSDAEKLESYRSDVMTAKQTDTKVYTASLIRRYCLEIPELRNVYVYMRPEANGSADVYAEATEENSDTIIGQPTDTVIDQIYKNDAGTESGVLVTDSETDDDRRDTTVTNYFANKAIARPVDVYLTGLSDTDISDTIKEKLEEVLYVIRPYIPAADISDDRNDKLEVPKLLSAVYEAISGTGITFTALSMTVDGDSETSYAFEYGDYPYLQTLYNDGNPI